MYIQCHASHVSDLRTLVEKRLDGREWIGMRARARVLAAGARSRDFGISLGKATLFSDFAEVLEFLVQFVFRLLCYNIAICTIQRFGLQLLIS